jgi:AcrR family transcriptional regulator
MIPRPGSQIPGREKRIYGSVSWLKPFRLFRSMLTFPKFRIIISNNKPTVGLLLLTNMARFVNKEIYEIRRNEILDAAQQLIYTKGYNQVSIHDILAELKISKGAFYHYFDSKQALLEALIERLAKQVEQLLKPIAEDDSLPASDKLKHLFDAASRWKTDRKEYLLNLVNVWYADENAVLRLKAQAAVLPEIAPLLTTIICQGVEEGVFHTEFPMQVSEILFSLLQSFGDTLIPLFIRPELYPEAFQRLEALSACYQDALERILGAEVGTLPLFDTAILREWFPLSNSIKE